MLPGRWVIGPTSWPGGLRTGKTKTIGLIVENISNAFFATLAKAIEDEAKKYDYKVVYCSTDNDEEKARDLINMLSQRQVDGYIITPTLQSGGRHPQVAGGEQACRPDRPVFSRASRRYPAVLVDNYEGWRRERNI